MKLIMEYCGTHSALMIAYVIGVAITDPVTAAVMLGIYEPKGGMGKSALMELIKVLTAGVSCYINRDEVGSASPHVSNDLFRLIAKYRLIISQDVVWELDGSFNSKKMKEMVSIDHQSTPVGEVVKGASFIVGMNQLPYIAPDQNAVALFRRRIFVTHTNKLKIKRRFVRPEPFTEDEKFEFLMECVCVGEKSGTPPFTAESFLYTLFGSSAGKKVRGVSFGVGSDEDYMVATNIIKIVSRIDDEYLHDVLSKHATCLYGTNGTSWWIKGIVPDATMIISNNTYLPSATGFGRKHQPSRMKVMKYLSTWDIPSWVRKFKIRLGLVAMNAAMVLMYPDDLRKKRNDTYDKKKSKKEIRQKVKDTYEYKSKKKSKSKAKKDKESSSDDSE